MALASSSYATAGWPATDREDAAAPALLVADDQPDVLEALRLLLKGEYRLDTAGAPAAILDAVETREFDAVLMDLNYARDTTSGREGLDLLSALRAHDPTLPVVVMTAWGSVEVAVEAMRRGARDFVQKPWDNARLLAILRTQVELARALRRQQRLEAENDALRPAVGPALVAEAPAMKAVAALVERVAPSSANILITGEHGSGRGRIAEAIAALSGRAGGRLLAVTAAGQAEALFDSELFGHAKGAFADARAERVGRFELADGGTLFVDDIAAVPLGSQSKLLRALETGDFERLGASRTRRASVRVLSASSAALPDEVAAGRFRQDLLLRLNTVEIAIPPLRQRREDIPALAHHFLRQHASRYRKAIEGFEMAAMQAMLAHAWPGNLRELDHAVERAVLVATGAIVRVADLALRGDRDAIRRLEDMSLEDVEAFLVKKAIDRFEGNVSQAARALGLSRSALYRRLQRYGL